MSTGFSGSSTRGMGKFEREVESRMKRLDVFTDDFKRDRDAARDSLPGIDSRYRKGDEYQSPHDDFRPEANPSFKLAASGREEDQSGLDLIDRVEQKMASKIKGYDDQFPGAELKKKLKGEVEGDVVRKKRWENEIKDPGETHPHQTFEKRMEKRLAEEREKDLKALASDSEWSVQSIVISKEKAKSASEARKIAEKFAKGDPGEVDETSNSFRYRQKQPGRYGKFRTIQPEEGVSIVYGHEKQ